MIILLLRIPVVPGMNDMAGEMEHIADLACKLPAVSRVELLPYHNIMTGKYESLGIEYKLKDIITPSKEQLANLAKVFAQRGLSVQKCTVNIL